MSLIDVVGLIGAGLILAAFAGVQLKRLDPHALPALLLNLSGACLVMLSLWPRFAQGAFLLEVAWAVVAIYGLVRLAMRPRA